MRTRMEWAITGKTLDEMTREELIEVIGHLLAAEKQAQERHRGDLRVLAGGKR